jgi:DNA-directed RNA polymerase subunit RPC12/RpoP
MAIAQGNCPNCGAPIEFAVGSSWALVCQYCRHTVVRSDRGLTGLGKVADLVETASLIAVGDEGSLSGRPLRVMGRVQLDYGQGAWDEYYVAFDAGQSWGWLAYAQGRWYATTHVTEVQAPPSSQLRLELDVPLGAAGNFRVAEIKTARVASTEGELPEAYPSGFVRKYADLSGPRGAFATLDYGDETKAAEVFLGWEFSEPSLTVTALGPRSARKVPLTSLKCPNCGGDVPALAPDRSERLACPYCGAISDIAERKVIQEQTRARAEPVIPIGSVGTLSGVAYTCLAFLRRGSDFEGELYEWEEFLLFNSSVGFRWLVLDPERGWSFVEPIALSDLDLSHMPRRVRLGSQTLIRQNQASARVTYVLGEVYWRCQVGETARVVDYADGKHVISREEVPGEVHWSRGVPLSWPHVARAFGLRAGAPSAGRAARGLSSGALILVCMAGVLCVIFLLLVLSSSDVASAGGMVYRGGGIYTGGK